MKNVIKELLNHKGKKFYSFSTACLSLLDESNRINEILKKRNKQVQDVKNAEFIVVTTCAVSKDSANNSVKNIINLSKKSDNKPIFVGGCLSNAKEREALIKLGNIKFFTANDIFDKISVVDKICDNTTMRCDPFWLTHMEEKKDKLDKLKKGNPKLANLYAFTTDGIIFSHMPFKFDTIRISKGCNKNCSYCAIPNNRGKYQEHSFDYVKKQISKSKHKYLLLIGENIGCHAHFNEIIDYAIKKKKKIMLRYLEPEYVYKIKSEYLNNITYIGVPVQSGSIKVLKDMRRPINIGFIKEKFKEWHKMGIFLGTSLILSYPTESFKDYLKTVWFIMSTPIDYVSFQNFSPRENSPVFGTYKNWNDHGFITDKKFGFLDFVVGIKAKLSYLKIKYLGGK